MGKQVDRRAAIFQAGYPITSQTFNTAVMLTEAHYDVELFCHNKWNGWRYVEFERFAGREGVRVYDLRLPERTMVENPPPAVSTRPSLSTHRVEALLRRTLPSFGSLRGRAGSGLRTARHAYLLARGSYEGLLPQGIVRQAIRLMAGKTYRCLIGMEKRGLIWAGQVAESFAVPVIYYSSELYTEDYQRAVVGRSIAFKRLRLAERRYHRKASATIVQDAERAQILFDDNRVSLAGATVFYVPVSLLGEPCLEPSRFLQQSLGIPVEQKVILYFGSLRERRDVLELARVAQAFPEGWVLVLHGEEYDPVVQQIQALDRQKRVLISRELVPSDQIKKVIASAHIGLAFYSNQTQNERLTAFSSEKMALYMQCGVPFIAYDYSGYRRLAAEDRCGMVVQNLRELPDAIERILRSHGEFRSRAHQTFNKYYDFSHNFAPVIQRMETLGERLTV